jgi:NAD(P)-dependent dehydrogenase (short-subunit alcohol dehydrogenase family)
VVQNLFDVTGKIVVVTGGMGQLGSEYSLALAECGAKVAVLDLAVTSEDVARRYGNRANDPNLLFIAADVTNRTSLDAALAQIERTWGTPHALVNNAALDSPPDAPAEETGPFEHYPEASWDAVMAVNAKGVFLCCQVFGGAMAAAGRGSIINICSIYGMRSPNQHIYAYREAERGKPFFKPVAYSASKSSLLNLTRYLATYWAGQGVRVNTLTLSGVFNHQDEHFLENYYALIPIGRMARQDEFNGAVIFLASDASSYMTGANLVIDGGWTAW